MSNPNGELARSWFEQVWNAGDEGAIDRLMAASAKLHGLPAPDGGPVVGPAGFRPFYHAFRAAFPDLRVRVLRTICEGDMVACHCVVTGTPGFMMYGWTGRSPAGSAASPPAQGARCARRPG